MKVFKTNAEKGSPRCFVEDGHLKICNDYKRIKIGRNDIPCPDSITLRVWNAMSGDGLIAVELTIAEQLALMDAITKNLISRESLLKEAEEAKPRRKSKATQ